MSYILNIETATRNCSVAVAKNGEVLVCREIAEQNSSHAEKLHVFIDAVLNQLNISFSDLAAVAVSKGPGSYTGLRIGVSAAKGICYALNIPLIAVDTLQVLALQANIPEGILVPMIDARRMEVYSAVFNPAHEMIRGVEAQIITSESFSDETQKLYVIGDCQEKVQTMLSRSNVAFLNDIVFPSAKEMAPISFSKFQQGVFEDVAYFEPFYLKDFLTAPPKKQ